MLNPYRVRRSDWVLSMNGYADTDSLRLVRAGPLALTAEATGGKFIAFRRPTLGWAGVTNLGA